jgi:hypothetical protein
LIVSAEASSEKISERSGNRTDLCKTECTGERKPRDGNLIVDGDQCFIRQGDHYLQYSIPGETKQLMMRFDRGGPDDTLIGDYTFELPKA